MPTLRVSAPLGHNSCNCLHFGLELNTNWDGIDDDLGLELSINWHRIENEIDSKLTKFSIWRNFLIIFCKLMTAKFLNNFLSLQYTL